MTTLLSDTTLLQNIRVESSLPGRLRLRIPKESCANEIMTEAVTLLNGVSGIKQVVTNPFTGSVLVRYDTTVLDIDQLIELGKNANIIAPELVEPREQTAEVNVDGPSKVTQEIFSSIRDFDTNVSRKTHGLVDAKTLVPLALIGLAFTRAFINRSRPVIPWYTLVWYGYSIFIHWNRQYAHKS
ncbi:MAG TPA: hypothetical protein VHV83_06455 [Armatimonadota bacterium]|nr:hypothetical protein [Armatimonadota bacterium]